MILKYGEDFEAMQKDIKLNIYLWSLSQIKKNFTIF